MFDYLIKNGTVVDGTGNERFLGDVSVSNGIITGVGFGLGDLLSLNFQLRYLDTMLPLRSYELNGSNVDLSGYEATLSTRGLGAQLSLGFRF